MLGIKDFEFYSGDKSVVEYMLTKLIIAKQIESIGVKVPDDYLFYEQFYMDYIDQEFYMQPVIEFMEITKIGKIELIEEKDDFAQTATVQFHTLDALNKMELREVSKTSIEYYKSLFLEEFKHSDVEVECFFEDNLAELSFEYWMNFSWMKEITQIILDFHRNIESILKTETENQI